MQTKLSLLLLPLTYQLGLAIQYPYNNNNTTTNEKMRSFELTQEEDFNVHGAFAILELAGESDLAETLRNGDWRVMPQAFRVLKKNVVNEHDAELAKEAEEHVQEYYNLLGRYLGVYPRDIDDVPTVLQNLHKYVDHATQKTLSDFLRLFLADDGIGYMDFLSEASKLDISDTSQNHPYMINVLLECSRVIIDEYNPKAEDLPPNTVFSLGTVTDEPVVDDDNKDELDDLVGGVLDLNAAWYKGDTAAIPLQGKVLGA